MKDRKRNRIRDFDYSSNNLYFVTSCIKDRICWFGKIEQGRMILNEFGEIAHRQWEWLINRYPYLKSHAFVVMPNHIHGFLEINCDFVHDKRTDPYDRTGRDLSLRAQMKIKPLSELIGAYKTTTSKQIHLLGCNDFAWQRSFYDNINRDSKSYTKIIEYITHNPVNWNEDRFNR